MGFEVVIGDFAMHTGHDSQQTKSLRQMSSLKFHETSFMLIEHVPLVWEGFHEKSALLCHSQLGNSNLQQKKREGQYISKVIRQVMIAYCILIFRILMFANKNSRPGHVSLDLVGHLAATEHQMVRCCLKRGESGATKISEVSEGIYKWFVRKTWNTNNKYCVVIMVF